MASQTRTETITPAVIHIVPPAASTAATPQEQQETTEHPKQVAWVEGTLDNEDLGRKSSKVCCIYHKPVAFGESSSSSSSSSEDELDSNGNVRRVKKKKRAKRSRREEHVWGDKHCSQGAADEKKGQPDTGK
ncbi:hypothetical protein, conserved [Eimeria tenella]|uniref:Type 1 phosphatases regulator n=1 Tax=Eimeria tenella TaxID=5802 RepID=H9B9T2_EIMTE|nr:hypothetical protein, conserved [Eimeria tenella]AET50742.1 hypothetical protein [Eimeria tenella]CDJ37086.1 hypothetical protein, conserved [Eimeria tenella]|eukprot:XP_013227924.1 hypothetical protein, conserved [Eimeria tenella]